MPQTGSMPQAGSMTQLAGTRPVGRLAERLFGGFFAEVRRNKYLFLLLLLPAIAYFVTFHYLPMIGVIIAFQKYRVTLGFFRSPWVGLDQFRAFLTSIYSFKIIRNTFLLSFYSLLFGFPIPILFAIALNEVRSKLHKRAIQTVSYLPYFISNVIAVGIVNMLVSPQSGVINLVLEEVFRLEKVFFLVEPEYFRGIYVTTVIWKGFGFTAVIYLAAIAGISPGAVRGGDRRWCLQDAADPPHYHPGDQEHDGGAAADRDRQHYERRVRTGVSALQPDHLRDRRRDRHLRLPQGDRRVRGPSQSQFSRRRWACSIPWSTPRCCCPANAIARRWLGYSLF